MVTLRRSVLVPVALTLSVFGVTQVSHVNRVEAQVVAVAVDAAVIVEGRVTNVFQSDNDALVQILVQKSELPGFANAARASYPAPGEYVYVHVTPDNAAVDRFGRRVAGNGMPAVQSNVRATLAMDQSGQWAADGRDWYQAASGNTIGSTAQVPINQSAGTLGVVTQRVVSGREIALKVVSVTPGSPAATAGIEQGDVLVRANREPLESGEKLEELFRDSPRGISLTVRDVRSGRDVEVDALKTADSPAATPRSSSSMRPLGVTSKLAFFSGEPALEITAVQPNSPAAQAGLKPGLLILKANGQAVGSPQELTTAERDSRGRLDLQVVDPKDKREQNIRVSL